MPVHYVYVLVSLRDGNCYVGRTNHLLRRFWQHKEGLVASTKHRRPLVMVHWEALPDKKQAHQRERWLKTPDAAEIKSKLRSQVRTGL
jgi:putative endonuclease